MTPPLYLLVAITLVGVLAILFVTLRNGNKPSQPDQSVLMLQQQLSSLQQRLDAYGQSVTEHLQHTTASMNTRLDKAVGVMSDMLDNGSQLHDGRSIGRERVTMI